MTLFTDPTNVIFSFKFLFVSHFFSLHLPYLNLLLNFNFAFASILECPHPLFTQPVTFTDPTTTNVIFLFKYLFVLPFSRLAFLIWIFFPVFVPSSPQLSIRPAVSGTTRSHKFPTGEDRPLVCRPGALRPEKQWFDKSAVPGGLPSADPRDHQPPEHCQPTTRANSCTDLWTGFSLRNNGSELLSMRENNQFTVFEWIIPSEIYYFQAILKWMNPFTHKY